MKTLLAFVLAGVAALGVSVRTAAAQASMNSMNLPFTSAAGSPGQATSNSAQLPVYAPSDIAVSSGARDDHRSRGRQVIPVRKSARTAPYSDASAFNLPKLCFQPGIGWTTLSPAANEISPDENQSGANHVPIRRGTSPLAESVEVVECPSVPFALAATAGSSHGHSPGPSGADILNSSFDLNRDIEPYNSSQNFFGDYSLGEGSSSRPDTALEFPGGLKRSASVPSADPSVAIEELKALRRRAHISPVKLRQLSRNVPDMETRLELRQMHSEVKKRDQSKRLGDVQDTLASKGDSTGHKQTDRRDLMTMKRDCEKKTNPSKSKVCSLLKAGGIH